jgi:hypothetical protein
MCEMVDNFLRFPVFLGQVKTAPEQLVNIPCVVSMEECELGLLAPKTIKPLSICWLRLKTHATKTAQQTIGSN